MVWWIARMNSLGRRPQVGRLLEEVDLFAVELMRQKDPGFSPSFA